MTEPQQPRTRSGDSGRQADWTPRPDPTVLTTEALMREVAAMQTLLEKQMKSMDDLMDEKFAAVNKEFALVERQRVEQKGDAKEALAAALAAAKEAVCCSADTPVLCADLVWRPAGDLRVGDDLVALDEEGPHRSYRKATVTANSLREETLVRVTTPYGSVRCTPVHPWLVGGGSGHAWHWMEAQKLKPGTKVMHMLNVWNVESSYEAGWLAGILDGEGCLGFKSNGMARLSVSQVEGIVADTIDEALTRREVTVSRHVRAAGNYGSKGWLGLAQAQRHWEVNRRPDVMRLLGSLRPARLLEHSDEVWEGRRIRSVGCVSEVLSVDEAGTGTIAALSTSTRTYIAAGFAAHNTEQTIASEKSINKSESATDKRIDQLGEKFDTAFDGQRRDIDDVKQRLTVIESIKTGIGEAAQGFSTNMGLAIAGGGLLLSIMLVAGDVLTP